MQGSPSAATVTKSSISAARSKLGFELLKALHEHVCMPLVDPIRQPHAFYVGLRLVAIDDSDTGAQLLWCCALNRPLPVVKELDDGSCLSVICPDAKSRKSQAGEITLRVIEYSLPGVPGAQEP
jgi:hypothetical protein